LAATLEPILAGDSHSNYPEPPMGNWVRPAQSWIQNRGPAPVSSQIEWIVTRRLVGGLAEDTQWDTLRDGAAYPDRSSAFPMDASSRLKRRETSGRRPSEVGMGCKNWQGLPCYADQPIPRPNCS
jgi:hypothetical protein